MDQKNANDIPNFGEAIKYYRVLAKMTQEQLADNICAREYIGKVEKGKQVPTLFIVNAMSEKLGINLFDAFALMMEHNDFDTHQKIEALNDAIASRDAKKHMSLPQHMLRFRALGAGHHFNISSMFFRCIIQMNYMILKNLYSMLKKD